MENRSVVQTNVNFIEVIYKLLQRGDNYLNRIKADSDPLSRYIGIALVFVVISAWELTARSSINFQLLVSSPSLICGHIVNNASDVFRAFAYTGIESFFGLMLATAVSIGFAALFLYIPRLAGIVYPWLLVSQIIPFVCLAPLIILIFGSGISGKVFLSALMAFFPILTNLVAGIKSISRSQMELMRILRASRLMTVRHVVIPSCLPNFFASQRVAAPFSVIGAIVAEFNGAEMGIGKDIFIAAKRLEPEIMMVGILSGAILSGVIYSVGLICERQTGKWYREE